MNETVLLYLGKSHLQKNALITLLEAKQIAYIFLDDEDLHTSIISLFHKQQEATSAKQFPFDFILFKHNNREVIMEFYQAAKQLVHFTHKAILTTHNQDWLLHDLLTEINEEHLFFVDWERLHTVLKEANDLDHQAYEEASYESYKNAFIKAYMYAKSPQPNKDDIKAIIEEVETTKRALKRKEATTSQTN